MPQGTHDREEHCAEFYGRCKEIARAMSERGPFFLGDRFGLVDIALAPFYQRFLWVGGYYRGLEFPKETEFERLSVWWEATSSRASVANTLVCKRKLQASYIQYADNSATSDAAKSMRSSGKGQQHQQQC